MDAPASTAELPLAKSRPRVRDPFGIDLRALAALRVGLGALLLADLAYRFRDIDAFYTDDGVLPVIALKQTFEPMLSLHTLSGSASFQYVLFGIAGVFAVMLLLGWWTRLATFASFALFASVLNRNPLVTHGGDLLLRLLLFWSIFLPLGARWSLDARRRAARGKPAPPPGARELSVCSAALLLQICFVYWFNAFNKHDWIWWDGDAVAYALNLDYFATPLGKYLRNFPTLLRWMTWGVLLLEFAGPTLALSPLATSRLRLLIVPSFWALHAGLGLSMELGLFPLICMVAWVSFLPREAWDALERWFGRPGSTTAVTFRSPRVALQVVVGLILAYVLAWNVRSLDEERLKAYFPKSVNVVGETLQVHQHWGLFAPYPSTDDGWYVIPARLADGSEVDLFTGGGPVVWDKPDDVAATFRNTRWRKYLLNLYEAVWGHHRLYWAQHLCRTWNRAHPPERQVRTFQIWYVMERTLSATRTAEPKRLLTWSHDCADRPASQPLPTTAPRDLAQEGEQKDESGSL